MQVCSIQTSEARAPSSSRSQRKLQTHFRATSQQSSHQHAVSNHGAPRPELRAPTAVRETRNILSGRATSQAVSIQPTFLELRGQSFELQQPLEETRNIVTEMCHQLTVSSHWNTEVCSHRYIEFKPIGVLDPFNMFNGMPMPWSSLQPSR